MAWRTSYRLYNRRVPQSRRKVIQDDFELTAGLSSAAASRFQGVTICESHTRLESRTQREERERLLDSFDKTLESHNKILFRHGTNQ